MNVLITGSNTGFGKLAAISLARNGMTVIATMRNLSKGDDLLRISQEEELPIEIRQLDVCDPEMVKDCLSDASEIDAVVNNAGFEVTKIDVYFEFGKIDVCGCIPVPVCGEIF